MGLAEKRAAAEFESKIFPGLKQSIDEATGFTVPLEVRWDTLAKDGKYVASWGTAWPKLYFQPLIDGFKQIAADEMGKTALKDSLKQVVVQDAKPSYSSDFAEFTGGTLTIDYQFTNVDDVATRTTSLVKVLEKAL